jgi:hypothetical protein
MMAERRTRTIKKAACETTCEQVTRLDKQINGNGQPGIRQELQVLAAEAHAFFTTRIAQEETEKKFHDMRDAEIKEAALAAAAHIKIILDARHEKADRRDKIFKWVMSIAMLLITVFMAWRK